MTWRQYISILLLLAFTAGTFSEGFLLLSYYSNRAAYVSACENKSRPQLHCNGKCQFMKKWKQHENSNGAGSERKETAKMQKDATCMNAGDATPHYSTIRRYYTYNSDSKPVDRSFALLRPPQPATNTPA